VHSKNTLLIWSQEIGLLGEESRCLFSNGKRVFLRMIGEIFFFDNTENIEESRGFIF
jgi:hypothetical protein